MQTASTRLVFVTDANNGIGFEVVRQLAASHCTVLISAHNRGLGEEAAASKKTARPDMPASPCCPDFRLVDSNASIKQFATVAVPIVERDAKQSWRRQRAVGSDDGERHRVPIVGSSPGEGHGVRNLVKGRGRDLRRLKVDA